MRVSHYMTPSPLSIGIGDDYGTAFDVMQRHDLHHLPVVDAQGKVVGILTRRDLQLAARFFHEAPAEVADAMHTPVMTIAPDADLATAAELMMAQRIGCLPVVDATQRLSGMITETDLFRALRDLLAAGGSTDTP